MTKHSSAPLRTPCVADGFARETEEVGVTSAFERGVMPNGGARSATLERMSALSRTEMWCEGRSRLGPFPVEDRDGSLRAGGCSPFSLPTFFAAAKKVGAAPHRGEANRPIRMQGEANAVGKQPKTT